MSNNARRNNKKTASLEIKPKFLEERVLQLEKKPLVPMNPRQAEYIEAINTYDLVIATGYAGASKTYIPSMMAADALRKGEIKKIFLCRPNVSQSQSLGFFSGDVDQKLMNWLQPLVSVIRTRMGVTEFNMALAEKNIELIPLETIKGSSFNKDCWILVDEAEDLTISELKTVVTRGGGGKMILSGDTSQSFLNEDSGLAIFERMVEKSSLLKKRVGFIKFDKYEHIVRSPLCKDLIISFDKAGI